MNLYYLGSALNISTLYMIAGTGAALSFKTGELNLGGEGQIYLGGFLSGVILSSMVKVPSPFAVLTAFVVSFAVSGLITFFCGMLKLYRNADFIFTTYIASAAIIPFIDGLISGPCRSKTDNLLATDFIPENFRFQSIFKPSPLNSSAFFAILVCILFFILLYRRPYGRKITIYGKSNKFAKYAGYNEKNLSLSSAFISGGMHGLCGAIAVTGTYYTCHLGFYNGMGWNGFSAALLAGANPLLLIPSSLFLGFIQTYSTKYSLYHNFGFDMSSLIQAFILLLISFPLTKKAGNSK